MVASEKDFDKDALFAKNVKLHSNIDKEDIEVNSAIILASGVLFDLVKTFPKESTDTIVLPCDISAALLRKIAEFVEVLHKNFSKKLEKYLEKKENWIEFIPLKIDKFRHIAEAMECNDLIEGANAADFLIMPSFMSFCTYILAEKMRNMSLQEMREYMNEPEDEEQSSIFLQYPELRDL